MKINISENRYNISNMTGLATIDNIKADPTTGSIKISMDKQFPAPGPLTLRIPELKGPSMIFVTIDEVLQKHAVTNSNWFALVDLNVSSGKH